MQRVGESLGRTAFEVSCQSAERFSEDRYPQTKSHLGKPHQPQRPVWAPVMARVEQDSKDEVMVVPRLVLDPRKICPCVGRRSGMSLLGGATEVSARDRNDGGV